MSPEFSKRVEFYESWSRYQLDAMIEKWESELAARQSILAAARKAQKNQKRAAKKCDRLKTSA